MTKNLSRIYQIIFAVILLIGLQPLFQPATDAFPDGLADAVESSLGWRQEGVIFGEHQKLKVTDVTSGIGSSVAVDGDTAVFGVYLDDVGGNQYQGSAYVFVRSGGAWIEQQKLIADDGKALDKFGFSVAVEGDTILVGAYAAKYENEPNNGHGVVYVFERNNGVWTQQQRLTVNNGAGFGFDVALDDDTALMGTYYNTPEGAPNQGSAYVFIRNEGVWIEQQKLIASDGVIGDFFGIAVAVDGDAAVIGAYEDDIGENINQGSAYVFERDGNVWTEQQTLIANDGAGGKFFGYSVAVVGDTIMVGEPGFYVDGAVYVFARNNNNWSQEQKLIANHWPGERDNFGVSISMEGEMAIIGDPGAVNSNLRESIYVFVRNDGNWTQQQQLMASDGLWQNDYFGVSVALTRNTILVGAPADSPKGSVYVFGDQDLIPTATPTYIPSDTPTASFTPTDRQEPTATNTATSISEDATLTNTPTETATPSVTETPDSLTATNIPTDEPTSTLEPGITELILNGDFEVLDGDGKPAPWTVKNGSGDKAKCNKDKDGDGIPDKIVAYSGDCAFQFKNVVGEAGKLQQTIDLSSIVPTSSDSLNLSYFAQSKGGATVKAKVVFKYADDTKTKISVESSSAESYAEFTGSGILTNDAIEKAKIGVKSGQSAGKVYLDLVSLKHSAGSVEPTPTPLPPTDTPEARLSGSTR